MAIQKIKLTERYWVDGRGWGLDVLQLTGLPAHQMGDVHLVSLKPGAVRGNHLHAAATEWIVVFGGATTLAWDEPGGRPQQESYLDDEPYCVRIPSGVPHAIRNDDVRDVFLLSINDGQARETRKVAALLE